MSELIIAIVMFCKTQPQAVKCQEQVLACTWYEGKYASGYSPSLLPQCVAKQQTKAK